MITKICIADLFRLGVLLAILLTPLRSSSEEPLLCHLGESVVEEMSLQVSSNGKIDMTTLINSMIFLEQCPSSAVSSFRRSAEDKNELHDVWIADLKSARDAGTNKNLEAFLVSAHQSVVTYHEPSLTAFLDGIFDHLPTVPDNGSHGSDHMLEQQAALTLAKFSHCDGADCSSISDFLLFLLSGNPSAFWLAMHSDARDAAKWLSELPDSSFSGLPSDAGDRENIRRYLLKRISIPAQSDLQVEKSQCLRKLKSIKFRSWQ